VSCHRSVSAQTLTLGRRLIVCANKISIRVDSISTRACKYCQLGLSVLGSPTEPDVRCSITIIYHEDIRALLKAIDLITSLIFLILTENESDWKYRKTPNKKSSILKKYISWAYHISNLNCQSMCQVPMQITLTQNTNLRYIYNICTAYNEVSLSVLEFRIHPDSDFINEWTLLSSKLVPLVILTYRTNY